MELSLNGVQKPPRKFCTESCSAWLSRNFYKKVSTWPNGFFGRFHCIDFHLLTTTIQYPVVFSKFAFSHSLTRFWNFSTNYNLYSFWRSRFHQNSSHGFSSWNDRSTYEWNCCSQKNLWGCTESSSTQSTITFLV